MSYYLNGTNFTIVIPHIFLESNSFKWDKFLGDIVPLLSAVIIIIYTQRYTLKNLSIQLKQQEKLLFIQMNHEEITKNIKTLFKKIDGGNLYEISSFLSSVDGMYVPKELREKIIEIIKKDPNKKEFDKQEIQNLKHLMNEFLTYAPPF